VQSTATATGGAGGEGEGFGFTTGNGGNATATAMATNTGGPANATANSTAGTAGAVSNNATAGTAGTAISSATANGVTSADSIADGGSGSATARASSSGLFSFIQETAIAPADITGDAEGRGLINQGVVAPTYTTAAAYQSAAYVITTPLASDVAAAWTNDAKVKAAFNTNTANVNTLLLASMQYPTAGSGTSHDYSTVLEVNEANAQLNANGLVLGLLTNNIIGSGLLPGDSLRFRIERGGSSIVDQTFTTNPAVLSFFQNTVFDLGIENAALNGGNLDLQFLFDLTSTHAGSGIGAQFVLGSDGNAQGGTWNNPNGGTWATPLDWTANTLPNGAGVQVVMGSVITAPQVVTLDGSTSVGAIQFANTNSYTIASGTGGYALTLDNAGAAANLSVTAGNHSITAPITVTSAGVAANIAAGSTLSLSGKITGSGPLSVTGGGTLQLGAGIGEVDTTSLAVAGGARLDLNNNHIFVNYGDGPDPIALIAAMIASGYAGGAWTGSGIMSTSAQSNSTRYGIGYADSADLGNPAGLSSGTIEIKYTLLGDTNLDGVVNAIDFGILAANFNKGVTGWDKGDFNYDNVVSAIDFGELATNFNKGASQSADAELIAFAQANGLMADVPEPATATVVSIGLVGLLSCRRRRQFHPAASAGRRVSVN
jgi:hypothetical protein